jgi:hypothetical protein
MEVIVQNVKFALRSLTKRPAFALTVVTTLALAIGANTAIFSILHHCCPNYGRRTPKARSFSVQTGLPGWPSGKTLGVLSQLRQRQHGLDRARRDGRRFKRRIEPLPEGTVHE